MGRAARLGKNWYEGGVTVLRPSRRARWALLRMRKAFDGIKKIPHPEETAKAVVSKDARCRSSRLGFLAQRRSSTHPTGILQDKGVETSECIQHWLLDAGDSALLGSTKSNRSVMVPIWGGKPGLAMPPAIRRYTSRNPRRIIPLT
jgi:hypothetical protein